MPSWIQLCFGDNGGSEDDRPSLSELQKCFQDPKGYQYRRAVVVQEAGPRPESRAKRQNKRAEFWKNVTEIANTSLRLRVSLGSGDICADKWVCSDREALDLFLIRDWEGVFHTTAQTGRIQSDNFFAEHVLEHFAPAQVETLIANAFLNLKPGGTFRVAVPDGYQPNEKYQLKIRAGKFEVVGRGAHAHRTVWHAESLPPLFRKFGFEVRRKEWWDVEGVFRTSLGEMRDGVDPYEREEELGIVRRSDRHDWRNQEGLKQQSQKITSLWFDAVRPQGCGVV